MSDTHRELARRCGIRLLPKPETCEVLVDAGTGYFPTHPRFVNDIIEARAARALRERDYTVVVDARGFWLAEGSTTYNTELRYRYVDVEALDATNYPTALLAACEAAGIGKEAGRE